MIYQLISVFGLAGLVLIERRRYERLEREKYQASEREDREVAQLEEWWQQS